MEKYYSCIMFDAAYFASVAVMAYYYNRDFAINSIKNAKLILLLLCISGFVGALGFNLTYISYINTEYRMYLAFHAWFSVVCWYIKHSKYVLFMEMKEDVNVFSYYHN